MWSSSAPAPGSDIVRFAGQRVTQAAIDAGIRTAIAGGSFGDHLGDSLENAVAHVVSGVLFNAVGDLANEQLWQEGAPQKIALHALIGGSVSEAMGGDFATGALAAGASEALVNELMSDASRAEFSNAAAQIVGIVAAELAGGDVNDGAFIAGQVESYNRQLHTAERELARDLAESSDGQFTLEEIESALRGLPNHALGEGPYDNIHVPLQPGLSPEEMGYYDFGAEWVQVQYADGSHGMVQAIPNVPRDGLYAFIVEQTGGRNSPYWTPAPNRGVPVPRESQPVFPGSIAMASGLPYNLNSPDLRTPEQQQQDMEAFVRGTSSLAAVPFGTAYASMLGARSAIGYFGVGASFDMAGQGIQEGDYRFGQTMMAGGTSLLFGPMAGSSIIGNAILGGAAGGTQTSATNWMHDESKSVLTGALFGAGASAGGTMAGNFVGQEMRNIPSQIGLPLFQTSATVPFTMPTADALGNAAETVISNMPAFIPLPDASDER
ncbi:DUF637 domain-containing protein [Halomonas sp. TA6]|uniref:DUF637 domain-containing protein n=1 Tax=Halomonas sp. TA6 TaxID=2730854 RepID=UPI001ABF9681|nr:DUF637 domain-containing protein [Halomonas sp. TA6]